MFKDVEENKLKINLQMKTLSSETDIPEMMNQSNPTPKQGENASKPKVPVVCGSVSTDDTDRIREGEETECRRG